MCRPACKALLTPTMMMQRDAIFPAHRQALYEANCYSAAIRHGELLFVSGQVGSHPDGSPEPDPEAQIRLAFDNLLQVLDAAGCSFLDVIDVNLYLVDPPSLLEKVWKVLPSYWGQAPYPSLTAVGVTWLSGFIFEIKVIARLPSSQA